MPAARDAAGENVRASCKAWGAIVAGLRLGRSRAMRLAFVDIEQLSNPALDVPGFFPTQRGAFVLHTARRAATAFPDEVLRRGAPSRDLDAAADAGHDKPVDDVGRAVMHLDVKSQARSTEGLETKAHHACQWVPLQGGQGQLQRCELDDAHLHVAA